MIFFKEKVNGFLWKLNSNDIWALEDFPYDL